MLFQTRDTRPRIYDPRKYPVASQLTGRLSMWEPRRWKGKLPPASRHHTPSGIAVTVAIPSRAHLSQGTRRSITEEAGKVAKKK